MLEVSLRRHQIPRVMRISISLTDPNPTATEGGPNSKIVRQSGLCSLWDTVGSPDCSMHQLQDSMSSCCECVPSMRLAREARARRKDRRRLSAISRNMSGRLNILGGPRWMRLLCCGLVLIWSLEGSFVLGCKWVREVSASRGESCSEFALSYLVS